ncbi:BON domain protein, partial [Vibrio harveyi]
PPRLNQHY